MVSRGTLPKDIWSCPACEEGWQHYVIASDQNVCTKCGYTGGDPKKWKKLVDAVRQANQESVVAK